MTRGGQAKSGEGPERRCIVSGRTSTRAGLIRFVVGPDGVAVPDLAARLPGRGIWVSADRAALEKAAAKGLFARAARMPVRAPENLAALVEGMLARRVVDLLSMARKAGQAVTGYEKVKDWLVSGRAAVLVQASDASARGRMKLRPPEGGGTEGGRAEDGRTEGGGTLVSCLDSGEIGLAFGRERAIHAALAAGALSGRVVEEAARLAGLRCPGGQVGGDAAGKD